MIDSYNYSIFLVISSSHIIGVLGFWGFGVGRRTAAWCTSPVSGNINCAMVRGGWALKWERYWKDYECA